MERAAFRSGSRNASTASPGVLPAKGDEPDKPEDMPVVGGVGDVPELARFPAAKEFIAAHVHQLTRLPVEQGATFLQRGPMDMTLILVLFDRDHPALRVKSDRVSYYHHDARLLQAHSESDVHRDQPRLRDRCHQRELADPATAEQCR